MMARRSSSSSGSWGLVSTGTARSVCDFSCAFCRVEGQRHARRRKVSLHPIFAAIERQALSQAAALCQERFEKRGEFPHLHAVDGIAVSEQALEYVREGPSFLRRYLPLWAADWTARRAPRKQISDISVRPKTY